MKQDTDQKPYVDYFENNGYIHVNDIITEDLAHVATNYGLLQNKLFPRTEEDKQIPDTHAVYSDPLMESIMINILPKVEYYSGKRLYPTYTYYRVYKRGDELKVHKDRESCEISCTLTLGFSDVWPIFVGNSGPVAMKPGEAVIYKGCDYEHWREPFEGEWAVQVFCHYVDVNGPNKDFFMDQRGDIYDLKDALQVDPSHIHIRNKNT